MRHFCTLFNSYYQYHSFNLYDSLSKNHVDFQVVLFIRMMFNAKDRDIYTLQKSTLASNGPELLPEGSVDAKIKYPHTAHSLPKFRKLLFTNYSMKWAFEEKKALIKL